MIVDRVAELTGTAVSQIRSLGSQHRWRTYRATLADGREVFVKAADEPLGALLPAEARGLRWLAEPGHAPVPEVLGCDESMLVLSWLRSGRPDQSAAERFGRDLAAVHAAGADSFGASWQGFIASLPLDNTPGDAWPSWYAQRRLAPFVRRAADAGALHGGDVRLIETVMARIDEMAGPAQPPARIHGDCWSGNVMWAQGRGWLIDPAAHGGHRETDLAMLALFGAPYLDRILAAYGEAAPLADGWRARVPLHQLHPLLVHVCLFGASYRGATLEAARAALVAG
ncbi:MAG: fructosamine kinase family protein [Micromonosporaceae bacterium]